MNGKFTCGTKAFQWVVGHRALSPKDSFTKNGDVAFERHGPFQGYRVKWKSTSLPPFFPWLYVCKTQMLEEEKNIWGGKEYQFFSFQVTQVTFC